MIFDVRGTEQEPTHHKNPTGYTGDNVSPLARIWNLEADLQPEKKRNQKTNKNRVCRQRRTVVMILDSIITWTFFTGRCPPSAVECQSKCHEV